jgi:hypothetical protein
VADLLQCATLILLTQTLELCIKQRKKSNDNIALSYMNLDVLAGMLVSCKRLFSAAKFILIDFRKSTLPSVFKATLLLKFNYTSEWDVHAAGKALGRISGAPGFGAGDPTTSCMCEEMMVIRPPMTLTYSTLNMTSLVT